MSNSRPKITTLLHPAKRLIKLRTSLGLSQAELAAEFRVTQGAVARWEMGTREVPGPVIKLMEFYERSLNNEAAKIDPQITEKLKEHFESFGGEDSERALRILEKGFFSFVREQSQPDGVSGRVKLMLIDKLLTSLEKSCGVSAKIAQLASFMELGLPDDVRKALGTLQSRAKPMKTSIVLNILKEEYGSHFKKIFTYWHEEPLAATSMGQVHYARLVDGQEVAVKVQRKDIQATLESQFNRLEILQSLTALFGKHSSDVLPQLRKGLLQECDYRKEAEHQEKFRHALAHDPRVLVPKVHHELLRDRVLVTDFVKGKSFQTFIATATPKEKERAAEALIESLATMAFGHCLTQTDLHPENFLFVDGKVVLLDFGRVIAHDPEAMKVQCQFFLACIEERNYERARALALKACGVDKNDFDDFWRLMFDSHSHLLTDDKFHFSRGYAKHITRICKTYSKSHHSRIDSKMLWGTVFSVSTWGLYADLDAKINFRRIALKTIRMGTNPSSFHCH